jgi:uncharacterized protein (DUF169 family)/NAD-dependent dihydropyrimidine dehydrogenase PreA subunit
MNTGKDIAVPDVEQIRVAHGAVADFDVTNAYRDEPDYVIHLDAAVCTGCGLCAAFCPLEIYTMLDGRPVVGDESACWGCETCSGQCPVHALRIEALPTALAKRAAVEVATPIDTELADQYRAWAASLKEILDLRWHPVAVSLIPTGAPLPDVPQPTERLRYCQSLMAARRGRKLLMPACKHACPDGTSILGLTGIPTKLATGEIYVLFHKMNDLAAAQRMVNERPMLPPRSIAATCVAPLDDPVAPADVVVVVCKPEQVMWICMSASYYTGHRHEFHASGFNAQCVEATLLPFTTKELNVSFGCYGCRGSSDVEDENMMIGIPIELMPTIVKGLTELARKAIPQARSKIYLGPFGE